MEGKFLISERELSDIQKRDIMWKIIKVLQSEGLSYRQAVELLGNTKDQLKNIPIKISIQ